MGPAAGAMQQPAVSRKRRLREKEGSRRCTPKQERRLKKSSRDKCGKTAPTETCRSPASFPVRSGGGRRHGSIQNRSKRKTGPPQDIHGARAKAASLRQSDRHSNCYGKAALPLQRSHAEM